MRSSSRIEVAGTQVAKFASSRRPISLRPEQYTRHHEFVSNWHHQGA
jgi:hypothetical protein